jgi:LmbE family N-acetylglucosaminyl deacetylase
VSTDAMKQLIKRLVKSAWRCAVPSNVRSSLRLWLLLDTPDFSPRLIKEFSADPVVVLAPHMDDEVIGPGGAVLRHLKAGAPVCFVFMTDGKAGGAAPDPALPAIRKAESRKAAEILGVKELIFLDGPDGALEDSPEIVGALLEILKQKKPGIIYAPALSDHHRDHWATNQILRKLLDQLPGEMAAKLLIRGYEIWSTAPVNRMIDITSVADTKRAAIEAFVSQTSQVDYSRAILGLNQYRSMRHMAGHGFAEAFLETTPGDYRQLFDQMKIKAPFTD